MPNQSQSGWTGNPWHTCDCCGADFHVSELRPQDGFLRCGECYDPPDNRERLIAEALENGVEEAGVAEILKQVGDDVPENQY